MSQYVQLIENQLKDPEQVNEASEVSFDELNVPKSILNFAKKFKYNLPDYGFDGIHGNIIELEPTQGPAMFGAPIRLDKKEISALSRIKEIRWIEASTGLSIGF